MHITKGDIALHPLKIQQLATVIHLVGVIHNGKNALGTRQSCENGRILIGDLIDGTGKAFGVGQHRLNVTDADIAGAAENDHSAARGRHQHVLKVAEEVHNGAHDRAPDTGLDRAIAVIGAVPLKGLDGGLLLAVGHHRAVGGDHLLHGAVHSTQQLLTGAEILAHKFGQLARDQDRKRNGDHGNKCHNGA